MAAMPCAIINVLAPVAQLDRAPDFESVGRRFESCRARHSQARGPERVPSRCESKGRAHQCRTRRSSRRSAVFCAPVAQLDRASASGAEGHRFESCRAHHFHRPNPERASNRCESKGRAHHFHRPNPERASNRCKSKGRAHHSCHSATPPKTLSEHPIGASRRVGRTISIDRTLSERCVAASRWVGRASSLSARQRHLVARRISRPQGPGRVRAHRSDGLRVEWHS
jgi:hypothetical protein